MSAERILVVNADDFGRTEGVNRGIARAHEEGIVTSASLMVRWPAAEEAGRYARQHPQLSVGLHLDLAEWEYFDGEWRATYQVVNADDAASVTAELERQLHEFRQLVGHDPTHLDSHQHVHRSEPVRSVLTDAGRRLGVVVRDVTAEVHYRGDFYGQDGRGYPVPEAITVEALVALMERLPPGVTELGCHPGVPGDLENVYSVERGWEVEVLCDRRVRATLDRAGITLRSFREVRELLG